MRETVPRHNLSSDNSRIVDPHEFVPTANGASAVGDQFAQGVSTETLILTPNGHVEQALHVVDDGESTWLTTEPGTTERGLVRWPRCQSSHRCSKNFRHC